jgi:glycosyltransferase involved in cell wall biosynthesis
MTTVLLYSPDVVGHPPIYCRVIADALTDRACNVVVAMGFTDKVGLSDSPDVQPLSSRTRVQVVSTGRFSYKSQPHLTAEEIVALQRHFEADATLFIEADKSKAEFIRIVVGEAPRLHGRNIGIFANTAEWYPGEDSFTGQRRTLLAPKMRTTLGNIKRAIFNRRDSAAYFYEGIIIRSGVLDEIFVKDERLAKWRGPPVYWMPEISRPACDSESMEDGAEVLHRRSEIEAFLADNSNREPVLYFGDAAYYKGYDLFLEFVASNPSTCAIHAGRSYDSQQKSWFSCDVEGLRGQIRRQGRLYETNGYVHANRLKQFLFESVRLYITTHRLALSSSTVIQALEFGKPVLVPDRGLIGYRIRENKLGGVYNYENLSDLARMAKTLWNADLGTFSAATKVYWQRFSHDSICKFFVERLAN